MNVDRSDSLDADDAFGLLGSEVRVAILRALGDAWDPESRAPLSFSELRKAAAVTDSGRFDYHLKQLLGTYVERADAGYQLTYPGVEVYQAIRAGTFNERPSIEPFELDADCFECGTPLTGSYDDLLFTIACDSCDRRYYNYRLPPAVITDAPRAATLDRLDRVVRRDLGSGAAGVCPSCDGPMAVTVGSDVGHILPDTGRSFPASVAYDCSLCGAHFESTVGAALADHPAFVAFHHERGVDLSDHRLWTLPFVDDPARTAVREDDPLRVGVTARHDGDALTVVVDDELSVVATERDA